MTERPTRPDDRTRETEREESAKRAGADRMPTEDEERLAEHKLDPEVAEHEKEMLERGARQRGEGRLP